MTTYNIDFEAWAKVQATDYESAMQLAHKIADAMSNSMLDEGIDISVVVCDDGISEEEEEE